MNAIGSQEPSYFQTSMQRREREMLSSAFSNEQWLQIRTREGYVDCY